MIIHNNNNNFSKVGTVVFYKHDPFVYFPENLNTIPRDQGGHSYSSYIELADYFSSDLVKYHGSTSNFPSINFAEYDFSYLVDKYKFDNAMLLSELDSNSAEIVGKNIEDTDKMGKILFPTLVDEEIDNPYKYFGSLNLNNGKYLYFLECPEYYSTIEIYEGVLDNNCNPEIFSGNKFIEYEYLKLLIDAGLIEIDDAIKPDIVLNLGPSKKSYNNPTEFYYDDDIYRPRANRTDEEYKYSLLDYSRLCDEIFNKKVVCLFLSTNNDSGDGNIIDFNLSAAAWNNNVNPARNKWKYDLRNDEFYSFSLGKSIVNNNGVIWEDIKAGTILGGNTELSPDLFPIKNSKLQYLRESQTDYYSPYRRYYKGETTKYKVILPDNNNTPVIYEVESLVDGNIGNDPLLSPAWILKEKLMDFITNIIYINSNPISGGYINPGTQITVSADSRVRFLISDSVGYSFNGYEPGSIQVELESDHSIVDLVEGVDGDYNYSVDDSETEYIKKVGIDRWTDFIEMGDKYTHNIIFNFSPRPSEAKFLVKKSGREYHYSEWVNAFGDSFGMALKLNGETVTPQIDSEGDLSLTIVNPETNPELEMNFTGDLIKRSVERNYRVGSIKNIDTIDVVNNDTAVDTVNYSDCKYVIDLESLHRIVTLKGDPSQFICDFNVYEVEASSDFSIDFRLVSHAQNRPTLYFTVDNTYFDNATGNTMSYDNSITFPVRSFPYNTQIMLNGEVTADFSLSIDGLNYTLTLRNLTKDIKVVIEL